MNERDDFTAAVDRAVRGATSPSATNPDRAMARTLADGLRPLRDLPPERVARMEARIFTPAPAGRRAGRFVGSWPLTRGPALVGLAAALAIVVALVSGALPRFGPAESVSAQTILDRAATTTGSPTATTPPYHLTAVATSALGPGVTRHVEAWFAGPDRHRADAVVTDASGAEIARTGTVVNSTEAWHYTTDASGTRVETGPPPRGQGLMVTGDEDVAGLIATLAAKGCGAPTRQSDGIVAGRAVYVIAMTPSDSTCTARRFNRAARTTLWVDKETFLPLAIAQDGTDGTSLYRYTVTSVTYHVTIPDGTFTDTPR